MAYLPIENYGLIGDLHTAALVGINGSIDWYCYPHFDSPSVFGAILDDNKGGRFRISPLCEAARKQFYWPETNVLVTRFLSADGLGEILDFMPILKPEKRESHLLVRRVSVVRGSMKFRVECHPAFDYARAKHELEFNPGCICLRSPKLHLGLATSHEFNQSGAGAVSEFVLEEGQSANFILQEIPHGGCAIPPEDAEVERLCRQTVDYWHRWVARCTYTGRWREMVLRSALLLKLMTFAPTGAIVAAPTSSLPEHVGGTRNWDYRYTWIRDAAFTLYGLMRIGFSEEAAQFMNWIEARCHELEPDGSLRVLYGVDGRHEVLEQELGHLEGYRGSRPVRIGNGAAGQFQLDIYGELMDSVYLYNKYGSPISYDLWRELRRMLNWVCENWHREDYGIWEVRCGPRPFVYSKLMCWVALDRGLRLADKRSFPADRDRWLKARDAVYEEILARGWHQERNSFVQSYGSDALDASVLMMPLVFFMSPTDPRMLRTLDAVNLSPKRGGLTADSLVYRYLHHEAPDGFREGEGTFNLCTFWLVEALTRAGRTDPARLERARLKFEKMLGYANHLGLYGEETGLHGEALGNFPQAFTHLALISAAFNLDRALGSGR